MARSKIDLVMGIIEIIEDSYDLDIDIATAHQIRNKLQLRLQKIKNDRLANILGELQEGLICRHWNYSSRKYTCHNDQLKHSSYCEEHKT